MVLDPTPGNVYLLKGSLACLKRIQKSDGIYWKNQCSSSEKGRKRNFYYYSAIPDKCKLEYLNLEQRKKKKSPQTKRVTFKRHITYDQKTSSFLVEYHGDDKQYHWKCSNRIANSRQKKPQSIPKPKCEDGFDKIVAKLGGDCGENTPTAQEVREAEPFVNLNKHSKLDNLLAIEELLNCDRTLLEKRLFNINTHQIVNPESGDCYFLDIQNAKYLKHPFHCDGLSWKKRHERSWNQYSYISMYFNLRKNSVQVPIFSKEMHLNSSLKLLVVHYYGADEISRKLTNHGNRLHGDVPYHPLTHHLKVKKIIRIMYISHE